MRKKGEEMAKELKDWTIDQDSKRSNESGRFKALVTEVERLIHNSTCSVLSKEAVYGLSRLIVAQLAHVHKLRPEDL